MLESWTLFVELMGRISNEVSQIVEMLVNSKTVYAEKSLTVDKNQDW